MSNKIKLVVGFIVLCVIIICGFNIYNSRVYPCSDSFEIAEEWLATPLDEIENTLNKGEICILYDHSRLNNGLYLLWYEGKSYVYHYRLVLTGCLPNADKDSTYVILSENPDITFNQAFMASGISSNMDDYFDIEEAKIVGMR